MENIKENITEEIKENVEKKKPTRKKVTGSIPSPATQLIITQVLSIMEEQEITPRMLCWDVQIDEGQFSKWTKFKANFSIDKIQEILDYLGYEMVLAPKGKSRS